MATFSIADVKEYPYHKEIYDYFVERVSDYKKYVTQKKDLLKEKRLELDRIKEDLSVKEEELEDLKYEYRRIKKYLQKQQIITQDI